MAAGSLERQESQADRKRLHRIELAALALLLLRRREAKDSAYPAFALADAVSGIVRETRQAARALGRETVARRFDVAETVDPATRFVDAARGQQIARNHVEYVKTEIAKAREAGADDPLKTALAETEWRAKTIAATEAHAAANEERLRAAREAAESLNIELFREWNAEADSCPLCAEVDGETVPISENFSNGYEPGSAHPGCRCWLEILTRTSERAA